MVKKKVIKNEENPLLVLNNDYLLSLADRLHLMNPSRDIIFNTLKDVASNYYGKGYKQKGEDICNAKARIEQKFQKKWNKLRDEIDDTIHPKK